MVSLSDKVTDALNEVRILILGAEILLGFQFRAVFQPQFEALSDTARTLNCLAYALMLLAVVLLIAPGSFHRLVEGGDDTARLHRFTTSLATAALGPFAACIGIDEFLVAGRIMDAVWAILAGCALALFAIAAWYVVELARKRRRRAIGEPTEQVMHTPIKEKIKTMGTEVRVILPGAQALLGFQFSAFLTDAFDKLPASTKFLHFASLTSMAIAVVLLMAPAAYHRIATGGEDTRDVDTFGSWAMLAAMVFLGAALAGDFYVILGMVMASQFLAALAAVIALAVAFLLWFGYPWAVRRKGRAIG